MTEQSALEALRELAATAKTEAQAAADKPGKPTMAYSYLSGRSVALHNAVKIVEAALTVAAPAETMCVCHHSLTPHKAGVGNCEQAAPTPDPRQSAEYRRGWAAREEAILAAVPGCEHDWHTAQHPNPKVYSICQSCEAVCYCHWRDDEGPMDATNWVVEPDCPSHTAAPATDMSPKEQYEYGEAVSAAVHAPATTEPRLLSLEDARKMVPAEDCGGRSYTKNESEDIARFMVLGAEIQEYPSSFRPDGKETLAEIFAKRSTSEPIQGNCAEGHSYHRWIHRETGACVEFQLTKSRGGQ